MSFEMTQGLFKFDFTDQHAILGVPLDAEFNDIRKRYMKIARRLHSDTCPFEEQADKDWANQFLSKVVNPAYNKFSKEGDRKEYTLLLTAIGKRAAKEPQKPQVESATAKQLATAANWEELYKTEVNKLSAKQYESVEQALEIINQISELNMVYLLRKENVIVSTGGGTPKPLTPGKTETEAVVKPLTPVDPPKPPDSEMDKYFRRAQKFMDSKNFAKATLELREAQKREPKNSKCHAMLAMCYFQQGQATMAKLEMQKALASNPEEPIALEVKKKLEQPASAKGKKGDEKPAGLFASFTNLFGGKKK
ncbi:tetratricopeptide repeat protein [Tychonema sp. BBK16]|uniref:J domain-containing protein n=1 Tax=Tychonema sp. BBK16 TaxID=2699888 RepID=UPI001F2FACBF|nr:tetratricopeptide repeat protein [Tychonema sp. BBK16]MCF6374057.1 tetratricopeptide repeat protein [Tychonema sp. BBK16]